MRGIFFTFASTWKDVTERVESASRVWSSPTVPGQQQLFLWIPLPPIARARSCPSCRFV